MKAYISIQNFGSDTQKADLCEGVANATHSAFAAAVNSAGNVVIACEVTELGGLLEQLSENAATNWIEYTLQFDAA
jgi:hypothetical protein